MTMIAQSQTEYIASPDSDYVDPNVEGILIAEAANGDPDKLAAYKHALREEERRGWCKVLLMDDEIAVVRWFDQFVLTVTGDGLANLGEGQ